MSPERLAKIRAFAGDAKPGSVEWTILELADAVDHERASHARTCAYAREVMASCSAFDSYDDEEERMAGELAMDALRAHIHVVGKL